MLENILIYVEAYTYIYIYISQNQGRWYYTCLHKLCTPLFFKTVILNFPKKTAS